MRLVWTTDIHLNHAQFSAWDRWLGEIAEARPHALVITGDISEADDVSFQLRRIAESVDSAIFFVLGNHDFYHSSIASTRRSVASLARETEGLCYLTDTQPIRLASGVYLLGEDGWGDATIGDFQGSTVRLNDFDLIKDFRRAEPIDWLDMLHRYGNESAMRLRGKLASLPEDCEKVLVATHVPPFRESCWYEGRQTDDNWAPFFVCGQVGDALREFAASVPDKTITVLCGHTHHGGKVDIADNLTVLTGSAEYGRPAIEQVFDL